MIARICNISRTNKEVPLNNGTHLCGVAEGRPHSGWVFFLCPPVFWIVGPLSCLFPCIHTHQIMQIDVDESDFEQVKLP